MNGRGDQVRPSNGYRTYYDEMDSAPSGPLNRLVERGRELFLAPGSVDVVRDERDAAYRASATARHGRVIQRLFQAEMHLHPGHRFSG